jgi:phosphohistidine phosphatase SixA
MLIKPAMLRIYPFLLLFLSLFLCSCAVHTYFVVRHTEKEPANTMTSDVPLSTPGEKRAQALADSLPVEIEQVWSTNTLRTRSTITPFLKKIRLSEDQLHLYGNDSLVYYIKTWKKLGTAVIVGHSNTVDDIVNGLLGRTELKDLPDSQFGDLFIVHRKKGIFGTHSSLIVKHFGL